MLRTGRAHPGMLDHVRVAAYEGGDRSPLSHVAAVNVRDAQTLVVTVYDAAVSAAVESAILDSPLGLTCQRASAEIVVPVPELSPQQRSSMAKLAKQAAEGAKERVRRLRQKAMDRAKKALKGGSKDEQKRVEQELQKMVDAANKGLTEAAAAKEAELMATA